MIITISSFTRPVEGDQAHPAQWGSITFELTQAHPDILSTDYALGIFGQNIHRRLDGTYAFRTDFVQRYARPIAEHLLHRFRLSMEDLEEVQDELVIDDPVAPAPAGGVNAVWANARLLDEIQIRRPQPAPRVRPARR